jgi:hypothetical protein
MFEDEEEVIDNQHSKWRRRTVVYTDQQKYLEPSEKDDEIHTYLKQDNKLKLVKALLR